MSGASRIAAEVRDYAHGRVPRALRERQVLAVAEELFADAGYAGASMDELAHRVGVSKPVIYALVGSKEHLFRRCVERQAQALAARISAASATETEPDAQFRAASLAFFRFVGEHRRLWEALTVEPGPFATEAAAIRRRQDDLVAQLLRTTAAAQGATPPARLLDAAARAINGANEALARWWRDHPELSAEQLAAWATDLLLPGLTHLFTAA